MGRAFRSNVWNAVALWALSAATAWAQAPNASMDRPQGFPAASPLGEPASPASAWPASTPQASQPLLQASLPRAPHATTVPSSVFEAAETMARVGDQYIFRGELLGDANLMLAPFLERLSPEERTAARAQVELERDKLLKQLLQNAIDRKLMFVEFLRSIPAAKYEEAMASIQSRVGETFEENLHKMLEKVEKADEKEAQDLARQDAQLYRLAVLMKQRSLTTTGQLAAVLRSYGSSLEMQQQSYAERMLGQQHMRQNIDIDPEVTHSEMLEYYDAHREEFRVPARARWQQLTLRFDHFKSREEAGQAIAVLGNELVLGGTPFWAVARRASHGSKAQEGGYHDWTNWGDLQISQPIHDAVFSLPVNKLSGIIEDAEGLHILRVLDREETHVVPFREAQVEIKKKIQDEKRNKSVNAYVARLKERTPVWRPEELR